MGLLADYNYRAPADFYKEGDKDAKDLIQQDLQNIIQEIQSLEEELYLLRKWKEGCENFIKRLNQQHSINTFSTYHD